MARLFPTAKCLEFLTQTKPIVFSVIRISIYCPTIPSYMNTIIQASIEKIISSYEFTCDQLSRSVQHLPQAKKIADEILKRFDLKKLASKDDLPDHQAEIVKLVPILDNLLKN